jgi:hypothetical protein
MSLFSSSTTTSSGVRGFLSEVLHWKIPSSTSSILVIAIFLPIIPPKSLQLVAAAIGTVIAANKESASHVLLCLNIFNAIIL